MAISAQTKTRNMIYTVVAEMFDTDVQNLDETSSPDTIERWDSMGHIQLIGALEQEFDMVFTPDEQSEMLNISLIIEIIESRIIKT